MFVPEPDAEVLDLEGLPLLDLLDGDDLAGRLLELPELTEEVPEPGLCHHRVSGEDPHAVEGRLGLLGRGQLAPDDLVLLEGPLGLHFAKQERDGLSCSKKSKAEKEVCDS